MTTYAESGVNISEGDNASHKAYAAAMSTFSSREGMIGKPVVLEGGFAGALDFGDYYLIMGSDGVGTKIDIALETNNFSGLGYDLLAMVTDDAICVGAETVAITNTVDTNKVNSENIGKMMDSLAAACKEQKVVVPGGEIAELGESLGTTTWNSSAVGIVEKEKYITGEKIQPGDTIISLREHGLRSNGFSLVRYILKQKGISYAAEFQPETTWGEVCLTPAIIYHDAVLHLLGRFQKERKIDVHGIAHITGGGIAGNLARILKKKKLGAELSDLWEPAEIMLRLQEIGDVADEEAYKTWNMGNGMLLIVALEDAEETRQLLSEKKIAAKVVGTITNDNKIQWKNKGFFQKEANFSTALH